MDEHLTNCDFTLVPCPNRCKQVEQLLRKDIEKHKMECLRRKYDCPHCNEAGEYEERKTKHLNECPMIEVPCPKCECKESILRCNISEHLQECMFEDVPCKYTNIGCKEKVSRRDLHRLKEHEGDSRQHLQLAIDAIQQQQSNISDMVTEMEQQKRTISDMAQSPQNKPLPPAKFVYKFTDFDSWRSRNPLRFSPKFYSSPGGYKMEIAVWANGDGVARGTHGHVSVNVYLRHGDNDDHVPWPFTGTVTIELLNQLEDKNHHSKTTTKVVNKERSFDLILKHLCYISHSDLCYNEAKNCQYLKDDCLYFRVTVEAENNWLIM